MENINNKMGQIDLANMKTQLNESLTKIKSNIINEMSNKTKMDERKSEFMMNVKNGLNKVKNLINYTEIMKNVNNSLANNVIGKQILEKVQNYSYYLNLLKNNIDMSKIVNSTRINGILSDIKTDMEKVPGKMKSKLQELNESLYTCDNEFIANKNFDLSNLKKNIDDTNNKLKTAKIGDLKGIFTDFSSMLLQDLKNKTKGINENSHFIALMKELNATLNKAKTEIMTQITTNAEFKPLLEDLNNKKNSLNQTFEEIKSSAIITSLKNRTNLTLEKIYNTKLSDIKEYSDKTKSKIKEEYNNIAKIEKVSQKTKYILDKYIIENNKTQNIIGKVFNTTKINNNITQLISLIENVENYYGEFKTENGAKKYNESKEYLQQQIKDINTKENLNNLKETMTQDFNDTLNLIKLLQKKYESIPDKDNKTELTNRIKAILKEEQEKLNLTEKISENIDPRVKEFILKVSDKIMSLKDKIGIPDNKTELLNILKEKVNSTQNNVNGLIEDLKGKNVTEIGKYLSEKTQTTLKVSIKEGLKRILDSEKINNIQNNENVLKLVEKLNNNKVIGSQFAQIMLNFTLFIKKLNDSVHRDDDSFYDGIKENVRNYWEKSNLKNNSELIKGMVENGLNLQEYKNIYTSVKSLIKEINNDIIGLMDELLNLFKNKKNNDKTKLRLLSINKNEINKRRIDTTGDLVCKIDDTFSEDETLTAEPENINSFVIKSNVDYNIKINSNINIKVDKNTVNNCGNNYTKYVSEKITFANISTLNKDNNKKRFNFKMRVRILRSFIIPDFFYLMMKVRLIIRLRNSRNLRNLDSEEEVPSFCLLEDDKNRDNSTFDCFGYNDNINENTNISIGNITSPYIEIPNNIFTTNEPGTNGTDPGENTDETRYHLHRSSKSSGLKGGAIAGIVIACVVVLALIIGLILFLRKRSNKPIPNPNPNSEETMKDLNFNFK